jgi:hypothetical protein
MRRSGCGNKKTASVTGGFPNIFEWRLFRGHQREQHQAHDDHADHNGDDQKDFQGQPGYANNVREMVARPFQ